MKVQEWKKQEVENLKQLLQEYPVIGIVDITNLPAMQLQKMRFKLKPDVHLVMTKSRLLKIAIDQIKDKKQGIEKLSDYLSNNIPILLFSRKDSFKLSKFLIKSKSSAAAKPGQKAPNDILIPAGPTEFTPGPIIGELGQAGLKTSVEGGKIVIKEDKIVAREGDMISNKVASVLAKLGIQPMKIGLNLLVTYDNGSIYDKDVLDISEEKYINLLKLAASMAFNLAFNIEYATKQNIILLLKKAALESMALESKIDLAKIKDEERSEQKKEIAEVHKQEPKFEHLHKPEAIEEPKHEIIKEHKEEPKIEKIPVKKIIEETKEEKKMIEKIERISHKPINRLDEESRVAQDILKKLQDEKMKKPLSMGPKKEKPIKKLKTDDIFKK